VSIVPPQGYTSWSRFDPNSFVTGEQYAIYIGRLQRAEGKEPVVFFHGYLGDPANIQDDDWQPLMASYAGNDHPVIVPELGGQSNWATTAVVDNGGLVDDAMDWAAATVNGGVRSDKALVHAISMGSLNALAWSYRLPNPGRIRAMTLVGPIINFEKFYNDNPIFQGVIDTNWGSHAAWLAGLPNSDPWRNIDKIRPYGHRIHLVYATGDEFIDPDDVLAFAELIGAKTTAVDTNHVGLITASPVDEMVSWALGTAVDRARAYIGWDERDWARFTRRILTQPAVVANRNINSVDTTVAPGGRRAQFHRLAGSDGNERYGYLLDEVSAPDLKVNNVWHNGDGGIMVGQHGNIPKGHIESGNYQLYMCWSNILFGIPWIVNMAVWTGTLDVDNLTLLGLQGATIPGLRLSAGGPILASSRAGGIVTLVVDQDDADRAYRSGTVDVVMAGAIGNYVGPVTRVDANHLQYALAGSDVTSGGPGSWADFASCFPYNADTELRGVNMRGRFYPLGMDPPDWADPDWTLHWTDTGGWGFRGYGNPGTMFGHCGINTPGQAATMQLGPFQADEL
jgi:hypothetical protein